MILICKTVALLLVTLAISFLSACASIPVTGIKKVADGRIVTFNEMVADIKDDRLIFIGEVHNNKAHHDLQLQVIQALHAAGVPLAIGLEMFSFDRQAALDQWIERKMELLEFMQVYRENWTLSWEQYDRILLFARKHNIPLLGLNAPRELVQKVYRSGFASLTADDKTWLPPGITCRIDTPYMKFISEMYEEHDMRGATLEHFCEAQSVRNQTMAWVALHYLAKNPQRQMVVMTGIGHAMKRGVPDELSQLSNLRYKVIIPHLSPVAMDTISGSDADYLVLGK